MFDNLAGPTILAICITGVALLLILTLVLRSECG